jgi:hypothetical protein
MVQIRKIHIYALLYQILKLVLVLPVATTTVWRCFSAMKLVKAYLSNKIGDNHLSYGLICYVKEGIIKKVINDALIGYFMNMEGR